MNKLLLTVLLLAPSSARALNGAAPDCYDLTRAVRKAEFGEIVRIMRGGISPDCGYWINGTMVLYGPAWLAAIEDDQFRPFELLVALDAKINEGHRGQNAAYFAVEYGRPEFLEFALKHGADFSGLQDRSDMLWAFNDGFRRAKNDERSLRLLELIAGSAPALLDPQALPEILHYAVTNSRPKTVAWLLEHGFDPNAIDRYGRTALHAAGERRFNASYHQVEPPPFDAEMIDRLLARGARLDAEDRDHMTPLDRATLVTPDPELVRHLLTRGARDHQRCGYQIDKPAECRTAVEHLAELMRFEQERGRETAAHLETLRAYAAFGKPL